MIGSCSRPAALDTPPAGTRAALEVAVEQSLPLQVETLPVPPADGPKLAALRLASPVYARPDKEAIKIGYLRIGARVARSAEQVSTQSCDGGWYAIRPLGFMCASEDATTRPDHVMAGGPELEPDRSRPLPYVYARVRRPMAVFQGLPNPGAPLSGEAPLAGLDASASAGDPGEDARDEGGAVGALLGPEEQASGAAAGAEARAGAHDVQLGRDGGEAAPAAPEAARAPLPDLGSVAPDGTLEVWPSEGRRVPSLLPARGGAGAGAAVEVPAGSRLALLGIVSGHGARGPRQLALTADGQLVPAGLLEREHGSSFHGQDLRELGLPVAFARHDGARYWVLRGNRLEAERTLARRELVPLTGTERVMGGEVMLESRQGPWLRQRDLHVATKPDELPPVAARAARWIDVSLDAQLLVLWERDVPVYATLVSTARDELSASGSRGTPRGTFRIQQKHVTARMPSGAEDGALGMWDVPWVMSVEGGGALHGAYWHDDFGKARSQGGIELSPIDARLVFLWSLPDVPEHWHGAYATASTGGGTPVRVRP